MANSIQKISLQETVGGKTLTLETGSIAKQAGGAATVRLGDTVVLTSATASQTPKDVSFIPLTSEYRERTYAAGRIPGGFFKRENRPREKEVLSSRLVDRPIRPLFPEGWNFETMVHSLVIASDIENDSDVLAITSASSALMLSDVPWDGPVAATRVAALEGKLVLFPTFEERDRADMELVVAGKKGAILMVEGGAKEVTEEFVIEALQVAQEAIDKLCELQTRLVAASAASGRNVTKRAVKAPEHPKEIREFIEPRAVEGVKSALRLKLDKRGLDEKISSLKESLKTAIAAEAQTPALVGGEAHVSAIVEDILYRESRAMALRDRQRPDGRGFEEIRPISIQVPFLPRIHGSALFTRGQTQALCTATLGSPADMQIMDELEGEYKERFLLHYNFPGFSVGEVKPERGPARREIGHGALARRALAPLLPSDEEFGYTIRIVSDILESNGSSSMASVCGGSLALFDAGVPMKAACAGVAMGLILEDGRHAILTDIAGIEDHNGDMDFKVAGTTKGITSFQLDMKVAGLSVDILKEALAQAKRGRLFILDKMAQAINQPRSQLSVYAPRLYRLTIPTDHIGQLIGPGGKNIRRLIDTYGVEIEVEDDGTVFISGVDADSCDRARAEVEALTQEAEIGKVYEGRVVSIKEFGAFVEILPGKEGLLHISQIDTKRVARVEDVLKQGDTVQVKVIEIDSSGRIRLSRRALLAGGGEGEPPQDDGKGSGGGHRGGRHQPAFPGGGHRPRNPR